MRLLVLPFVLALVLVSGALAQVSVGGPTQVQDPAYALRVRILTRNTSRGQFGIRMWGQADLFGQQEQGGWLRVYVQRGSHGDARGRAIQRTLEEAR